MIRQSWNRPPLKPAITTHQKIVSGFDMSNWEAWILVKNKTINGHLSRWPAIMILYVTRLNH